MEERQRLYVDMDGTLAVFTPVDTLETLYEKGYFANLVPHENVVAAVQDIIKNHPEVEVHILSAYLTDSQYALNEKNEWLDKHLPEIDQAHRVFVPCGSDKKEGIEGGIRQNDFLLDDYTHNLNDWQPPARGIKLLNAINHTKGSWEHDRIRFDREPHSLAEGIVSIMQGREQIFDERINKPMDNREREFLENLARFEYMRGESNIFPVYEPLSQATNPTAREVYQAEYDRVANLATEQPRMVVLTSEMVGYRNAPHDIAYNKAMTDRQMDRYEENKTAFLEDVYSRLGNRGVQPSDYYGHSPSVGDAVVVMKSDGTETHYVDTVGFEEEADVSKVMTEEQQKAAKMGLDVRSEWDMLQSIDEYARVYGNEQLYEAVEAETMGRMDFMRDNYMGVFNLAEIRGTIENESDKLEFIYQWEEDNGIADPLVLGEEDGHYYVSQDAIRAAMPDTRLANGNYVSDDARIVAGERLKANIDYRFERAATEFARENPSFYRFEASPSPLGEQGQYDAFVQRYDRSGNGTAIPRDIVYIGEAKRAAEVAQFLNAGQASEYGSALLENIELRRENRALPMQGMEADREAVADYISMNDRTEPIGNASISVEGHVGTWHIVDQTQRELPYNNGDQSAFYLLEHDTYGEDAAMLIVNKEAKVVLDDVWNGFDDLDEAIDNFAYSLQVLEEAGYTVVSVTDTMGCELEDNDTLIRGFVNYNDLTEHEGELVEAHYNKTIEAMEVAGYHLDIYESNSRNPIYNYDGQTTPLRFDSLKENMEWLDGVVFDDPEVANAVERIMHPNRFIDEAEPNLVTVQSASMANYEGMVVLSQFDRDGRGEIADSVYLGKAENYNGRGVYDNSDNSLIHVSDNLKMSSFLDASAGWVETQQRMIENGAFTEADYAEFASLKEGVLSQFTEVVPKKFEIDINGEKGNGVPFRYFNEESIYREIVDSIVSSSIASMEDARAMAEYYAPVYDGVLSEGEAIRAFEHERDRGHTWDIGENEVHYDRDKMFQREYEANKELLPLIRLGIEKGVSERDIKEVVGKVYDGQLYVDVNEAKEAFEKAVGGVVELNIFNNYENYLELYGVDAGRDAYDYVNGFDGYSLYLYDGEFYLESSEVNGYSHLDWMDAEHRELVSVAHGFDMSKETLSLAIKDFVSHENDRLIHDRADFDSARESGNAVRVAVESTMDYSDDTFHAMYEDNNKVNFYRLVTIGENGRVVPYNGDAFSSEEQLRESVEGQENLVFVSYDAMIDEAWKNITQREDELMTDQISHDANGVEMREEVARDLASRFSLDEIRAELDARYESGDIHTAQREAFADYSFYDLGRAERILQDQDPVLSERVKLGETVIEDWERGHGMMSDEQHNEVYNLIRNKDFPLAELENAIRTTLNEGGERMAENTSRYAGGEAYRFFYDNEDNSAERNRLVREEGWKQFWGADAQGLNGGTWVVYRDVADLPNWLQDYAREMEQYQPMPNRYYEADLDLDGTADELFTQARNGYIESPEALAKVQEILSNPVEQKTEQAFYVGVLREIAENEGNEYQVFAQMKKDILDDVQPEELSLRDGVTLEVRKEQDDVLVAIMENSADREATGASAISVEQFLSMSAQEISAMVNEVYAYNMIEAEREEDLERPFEKVTIDGHECNVVDTWMDGQDSYVLGNDIEDSSFYYVIINSDASNTFEYDTKPTREQVEDDFLNRESQRALDNYEAEFGADGRRSYEDILRYENELTTPLEKGVEQMAVNNSQSKEDILAEKIVDFFEKYDPTFGYAEGVEGQENRQDWIDTIRPRVTHQSVYIDMLELAKGNAEAQAEAGEIVGLYAELMGYQPMPNRYYEPDLDLDGTADELFTQARNGYIESPEALAKVQEILSNPVENKTEQAFYVGVLKEIAEDKGEEPYVFAQMKKDILDGVHPEEVSLRDGLTMEVLRDGNDSVVIDLRDYSAEDDASFIGGHSMSQDEFLKMNAQEFKELVNSIYAYNMVEQELDYEMERENERPFEEAAIEEPTEEKLTLHIQYQEPINMNGWVAEKDTITFDSREEMDKFISGDSAYDALDNAVSKKDNEILLYAVNEQNETVWISPEYAKSQAQEEVAKWEALKAVDPSKVICFDLETTGLDRKEDEILQLSVIDGNRNVLFNDYIRPTAHESWEQAQAVNGISPEMVADKQTIEEHRDRLNGIFANAELIVGYNHEYFDMEMLRNAGVTIPEATKSFDVMKEYAPIHGEWNEERGNYKWQKLQVCAEHYGFEPENGYHDSLEDVKATMHSFDGMVAEQSKEAYRDLAEATGAYEHLAERIDTFMYDNDYYEYSDNIGIDEEQRSISRESIAMDLRDGSNIPAMIETLQDMRELEHIDRDATAMREVNDLIYSLQNMEQYVQCYGNENRTPNTEHAVQEFRDRQGFMREGDQIAMVMSQIPNFSDRSIPFRAVQEFEDRNNLPEKERTIIDGGYEDKDFLYMAYDRYVAMSHQNDLSIQPYMEQITDLTKDRQYQYASPLPMIAEVYYAQQNGLSKEQIEYALEAVKDEKFPSDSFRNYRRGFEDGLTMEQMDVFKGEKDSTQEYLMEFMADGGSVEDAKALKGCDVAQYYLLKDPLKNGEMSREMAQAIIQSVNGIVEKSYEDYKAAVAENPDARPRFSSFDGEFFTEYFADAVQNDKNITPEMVMTVAREFSEQTATDRLSDFVKERGGFAAVSHRATEQQQETKKEEVAEERGVEMPVSKVDEKEVSKGVSLPEEKKDPKELLTAKLQQGVQEVLNSEKFKSWLDTSSKLFMNNYSFNNAMLVWMQRPDASHTMGYEQWKDYGRAVAQGSTGIKIFVPVIAYEKKDGDLWRMIKSNLTAQMKNDPSLTQATYRVGMSKLEITMNQNNLYGLRVGGVEQGIRSEKDMQDFIKHNVVGKVPMYFSVGTVFDAKDTITPEYLWVKKGYTKDEVVKGEDGKPIKNRKGEVKIVNTPERQARFNPSLDMSVPQKDPQKMAILYDALKAVSERNGIPVFERERDSDDTLKGGADGYYSRDFSEYPKGYIVMPTDLDPTKRVSVMLHEMTHSELHGNLEKLAQDMGEENVPRKMREIQAEAVAYTVGKQFGIDTDTSSFQYLAAYTSGFELQALSKSIEVIYKECQQVTKELEAELAIRGLNRDLTDRFNSPMEQEAVDTICKSYAEYACTQMERLESITAELPAIAKQSEGNDKALDVMVEKVNNIARQNEDVSIIFAGIDSIRSADTLDGQKDAIGIIEAAKERIEGDKAQFAELSSKYQEAMQSEQNLHSRFVSAPMATLEAMKQDYPQLEQLTTSQMQYLAKSEYVSRDLVPLLKSDPQTFVDKACERAAEIDKVASKNGMFVEVAFCEQWTDKPIVSDGALMHPKVAETIVKQAETQIRSLKAQAEQTGDYFPYSKCALTVFKAEKGQITDAFKTRVDIGDGSQSSLSDHLKQFSSAKDIAVDFEKATREKGAKEKIVFNDAVKEAVSHGATEVAEVADKPSKGMSKEDWMEEIGKVRQAQQNANNSQQQEQQSNRNAKNDKTH